MKWKKISFWIVGLLFIMVIVDWGLGKWINNSLPTFINEKNDTPYNFNYSRVSYSFLKRKMVIEDVVISPKVKNIGIYDIKIKNIVIRGVHFLTFFSKKDLIADLIEIDHPDIIITQAKNPVIDKKKFKVYDIGKSIQIENFILKKGSLKLFTSENHTIIASLKNIDITLYGVIWDIANVEKRIPISFNSEKLSVEDIFYQLNDLHYLKLARVNAENGTIKAERIEVKSIFSPEQFQQKKSLQKSLFNIQIPSAGIKKLNWGYDSIGVFYVNTSKIEVDSAQIQITSKNEIPKYKNTTSYIDRIIPFNLKIDSVQILKSKINLGNNLSSHNINILIKNITNKLNDKISIEELKLSDTNISLYSKNNTNSKVKSNFTYYFDDILNIKKFSVQNANVKYYNLKKINVLNMNNINYTMNDIIINTLITNTTKELPFTYSNYNLQANNILYTTHKNYFFHLDKMMLANDAFLAKNLKLSPKISQASFAKQKLSKHLFKITIANINIPKINWKIEHDILFIQAPSITIDKMLANVFVNKNVKSSPQKLHLNHSDVDLNIDINSFIITNSSINQYSAETNQILFSSNKFDLTVNDIIYNKTIPNKSLSLPFSFSKFNLAAYSTFFDLGYHTLLIDQINYKNNSLAISNLKMNPKNSLKPIMKKKGIDAYTISLDRLNIPNLNLGLPNKEVQFVAPQVTLYKLSTLIHQYDIPDKEYVAVYKPLLSKKLHDLTFKLQLGQLNLKNSDLSYEEESLDKGTGKIYFTDINATIKNIASGYKVSNLPDVTIDFKSNFMKSSQLSALWKFNVMNTEGNFSVSGKITNLPAQEIDMFIRPYLHISANGTLDQTLFYFNGNETIGKGTFGMKYKDLKVTLLKKEGQEEKKFLSSLANLAIKGSTEDSLKMYKIKEVKRPKDRSIFNFLWQMTLSGMKKVLLIF